MLARGEVSGVRNALVDPLCQLVSAFTSTGVSSMPYEQMGPAILIVLVVLVAVGACAGSTTGGLKVDRFMAIIKNMRNETVRVLYPNRMRPVSVNGVILSDPQVGKILAFTTYYILLWALVTFVTCLYGVPAVDSFFSTLSCIANNGLGYGVTGAGGSFGQLPVISKWLMSFLMMAGRLELFTVIALFMPQFWRH